MAKVKKNNIYIVEGFDGVGKDYYISKNLADKSFYRPNYDVYDRFFGRQDSWCIGFSIFDFLSKFTKTKNEVVINRCIASSLVYSELYNGKLHLHPDLNKLIDFYKKNKHFQEANHIHISHKDYDTALCMYEELSRRDFKEELDNFEGFAEYWKRYCEAESLYSKYYRILGITPTYIQKEYEVRENREAECPRYPDLKSSTARDMGLCEVCDTKCEVAKNEIITLH